MAEYQISEIHQTDSRALAQLDLLLRKEGIRRDKNLDNIAGLYDEDYHLAAAGACFGRTLRCLAVASVLQGEGLLNQLVTHLVDYQCRKGNIHLFLYTKCSKAAFFESLGFHEIARAGEETVFMENRRGGFERYLENLARETAEAPVKPAAVPETSQLPTGAVVLNANPFTLGHQYLLEQASASCGILHVFVVSENVSLVPFSVRYRLVREGCSHLHNVVFHSTGSYLISNATFPSYFLQDEESAIRSHARLDAALFSKIAGALSISVRFVGDEPLSRVTGTYNEILLEESERQSTSESQGTMKKGCRLVILPRLEHGGMPVSASQVRSLIRKGHLRELQGLVPETTLRYLLSPEAAPVIQAIQNAEQVIHY